MTAVSIERLVDEYIAHYREGATKLGPIKRFYTLQTNKAQDLQWQIQEETGDEAPLHAALRSLYTEWLGEMPPEERKAPFTYNSSLPGDHQDVILAEELEERYQ